MDQQNELHRIAGLLALRALEPYSNFQLGRGRAAQRSPIIQWPVWAATQIKPAVQWKQGGGGQCAKRFYLFIYLHFGLTLAVCHNKAFALFGSRPRRHQRWSSQSGKVHNGIIVGTNRGSSILKSIQPSILKPQSSKQYNPDVAQCLLTGSIMPREGKNNERQKVSCPWGWSPAGHRLHFTQQVCHFGRQAAAGYTGRSAPVLAKFGRLWCPAKLWCRKQLLDAEIPHRKC